MKVCFKKGQFLLFISLFLYSLVSAQDPNSVFAKFDTSINSSASSKSKIGSDLITIPASKQSLFPKSKNDAAVNSKGTSTMSTLSAESSGLKETMERGAMEAKLPAVVLPSPDNATLTRIISENVDLYTGRLSLDIPLYTLKSRDISVPISLQGNANAQKVNDIGSWVGLGWNLNAGGVITRVMKNLPDEFSSNVSGNRNISSFFNFPGVGYLSLNNNNVQLGRFVDPWPPFTAYSISEMKDVIHKGAWNTQKDPPSVGYDLQPDEFYFNFGKYSGKFVFDQSGNVVLQNDANIFITPTIQNGQIVSFVVNTDDGYKYEFGNPSLNAVEYSKLTNSSRSCLFTYRWTGILKQENATVTINNQNLQETVLRTVYETTPYVMSVSSPFGYICGDNRPYNLRDGSLMDFNLADNNHTTEFCTYPSSWYLTKITSPSGDYITFGYRDNGTLSYLADVNFSSSAPAGVGVGDLNSYYFDQSVNYYPQPPYFSIVGGMPKEFYGNGSGSAIIYNYPSFGDYTITRGQIQLTSKRLQQIVTSQGFKIEFISNTQRNDLPGDKSLDRITISNNGTLIKRFDFNYQNTYNSDPFENVQLNVKRPVNHRDNCVWQYTIGEPYTINEQVNLTNDVRYRMFLKSITEVGANGETIPAYTLDYYNIDGLPFRTSRSQDLYGFAKDNTAPSLNKMLSGVIQKITYPTGGWKQFSYDVSGNTGAWNGLKISSIEERESSTSSAVLKQYNYGPFDQVDQAISAYGMADVVQQSQNNSSLYFVTANKNFGSSTRVNPENLTHGAAGGYRWVEVSQPNNGKYRIEFTSAVDQDKKDVATNTILVSSLNGGFTQNITATLGYSFPFPPSSSNDWLRGLPTDEYYKDASGRTIQNIHYDYDFTSNSMGMNRSFGLQPTKYRIDRGTDWNWLLFGRYNCSPRWQLLKTKTEKTYAPDGTTSLEKATQFDYSQYTYNNKSVLYPKEIKLLSNSKGEQVVQKIKYPLDYANIVNPYDTYGLGINNLKTKNILSAPVESYQYVQDQAGNNKRYISGTINYYDAQSPVIKSILTYQPAGISTSFTESNTNSGSFNLDANYKSVIDFHKYNANGQILEQSKTNDQHEAYLWDYQSTYPVAKVTNASFSDIAYTSFEADGSCFTSTGVLPSEINTVAHTGKKIYRFNAGNPVYGPTQDLVPTQKSKYTFSCWVKTDPGFGTAFLVLHTSNPAGDAGTVFPQNAESYKTTTITNTNGQWKYFEVTLDLDKVKQLSGITQALRLRAYVYNVDASHGFVVDDYRLCPSDALMTTYTYSPLIGMTSTTDPNNRTTYYDYDGLGRLSVVRDQNKKILKKYCYNYAGQQEQCYFYESAAIDADYYSQNCSTGVVYHVTVPKGMFISYVDQPTADQLAQQYAQDQANQYGACLDVPVYGENNRGVSIIILLHNASSGQDYSFTVYPHDVSILNVPPGNYTITITPQSSGGWYNYSVGCGYWSDGPGAMTFYGVAINSGCNSIIID